jgi:type I restriction enzyme S subunit
MELKPGYKQTEVGMIPNDWEIKPMQDFGKFGKGIGLLKENIHTSGRIPGIPYTALYTDFSEIINYDQIKWFVDDPTKTYIVSEPCLLIASSSNMAANTGKTCALTGTASVAIGREVIIFKTPENCRFLSYLLSTPTYRKQTLALARGTTIKHLYTATFNNYKIALPSVSEQNIIADALGDIDRLLGRLDRLITKKRNLKLAAMQQLLTGQKRLPSFHDEWKIKQLGEVAEVFKGSGLSKNSLTLSGSRKCILYGELFTTYGRIIKDVISRTNSSDGRLSQFGDVLVPCSTTTTGIDLAIASVLLIEGIALGGDINIIRKIGASRFDPVFLANYLTYVKKWEIAEKAQGITIIHLYGRDLLSLSLRLPSLPEQIAIAAVLSDMDAEIAALEIHRDKTRAIKQGMMQELLTGRTRLV